MVGDGRVVPHFHPRVGARSAFQAIAHSTEGTPGSEGPNVHYFPFSRSGPPIELRAAATLLISILLPDSWRKQTWRVRSVSICHAKHIISLTDVFCILDAAAHL
jgi:hypothetical protein